MTWERFFTDPSMVALMVGALIALVVLWTWHRDDSAFDLRHLFLDPDNGKMSVSRTGAVTALVVSSWGFVSQIQDGNMTEWYFAGYMAAWGTVQVVSKAIDAFKGKKDANPSA